MFDDFMLARVGDERDDLEFTEEHVELESELEEYGAEPEEEIGRASGGERVYFRV
jgi:hypothetical protein